MPYSGFGNDPERLEWKFFSNKVEYITHSCIQGLEMLCKMGLSCHPKTVASKSKELGKAHDQELLNCRKTLQCNDEIKRGAEMLKDEMNALSYLPELPSAAEFQAHAEELKQPAPTTSTSSP